MKKCLIGITAAAALAASGFTAPAASAAPSLSTVSAATATKARLKVKVAGAPSGSVTVSGRGLLRKLHSTRTLTLRPGTYRIRAKQVQIGQTSYVPADAVIAVRTRGGHTSVVTVFYSRFEQRSRQGTVSSPPPGGILGEVYTLVNDARQRGATCGESQLPAVEPVAYDDELAKSAQGHAQDMADNDYFDHVSLDGRTFINRIKATNYIGDPGGENIASGFQTAQELVSGWLKSPGHCANLMDPDFDHVGLGLASRADARYSQPVTYWVQDFGYAAD